MPQPITAELVASLVGRLEEWRGSVVRVVEQITRRPGTLDRHFTTRSVLVFRLEHVGVAFSGAAVTLMGRAFGVDAEYQATLDGMERLETGPDAVVFVERFGEIVERHSEVRPVPEVAGG